MILDTFEQQPRDRLDYDVIYSDWLTPGDAIDTTKITIEVDKDGLTTFHVHSGEVIKVWVSGGANKTAYKISVTIETDDGRMKQDEFIVKVKDT